MRREHWVGMTVVWLGMFASVSKGQAPAPLPSGVPAQIVLPPGTTIIVPPAPGQPAAAPQQSSAGCADCERPAPGAGKDGRWHPGKRLAGATSRVYFNWIEPNCGTDGCLSPIGCGNFHTEFMFLFGSCRQFFGTGTAAPPSLLPPPPPPRH